MRCCHCGNTIDYIGATELSLCQRCIVEGNKRASEGIRLREEAESARERLLNLGLFCIVLTIGNFLYQVCANQNYGAASERSFFQISGILMYYWMEARYFGKEK